MARDLSVDVDSFPIRGSFTISRGAKTSAEVVCCTIRDTGASGRGECVPYRRYGETLESVADQIAEMRSDIANAIGRKELLSSMPPGAARNAIDCALWDLEAKLANRPAYHEACKTPPRPVTTAYTISLGDPDAMAVQARAHADKPLLKVKVGAEDDIARIRAVAGSAPHSRIILDANEAWTEATIHDNLLAAAEYHIDLVEQPLPAGNDELLRNIPHPVPICADESVHTADDLDRLAGLYDAVNIKLDKSGGLTAALELRDRAHEMGFSVMVGCMVGTSLAMAPAVLLAQEADYVDLDGPLLLARDRTPGLTYAGSLVSPPHRSLWG